MNLYQKLSALHAALAAIPKYVKLDDAGEPLPLDSSSHAAVLLPHASIVVWPHSLGRGKDHAECERLCRDLRAMGKDDWRLASRDEWQHVLDLVRRSPAVDTSIFPGIKSEWHWTSTALSGLPDYAWFVSAYGGVVDGYHRDYSGFALAVRSVGQ